MLDLFSIYYKDAYLMYRSDPSNIRLGFALECKEKVWKEFIVLAQVNNLKLSDFEGSILGLKTNLMSRLELDSIFAQFSDFGTEDTTEEIIELAAGILFDGAYTFVTKFLKSNDEQQIRMGVWFKLASLVGVNREILELQRYFGKTEPVIPRLNSDLEKEVEELYKYYREVR